MKYPDGTRVKRTQQLLPPAANGAVEAVTLSSAHDRAPSLRLHRTVPAVEGGTTTVRPAVGSRNQPRLPCRGLPTAATATVSARRGWAPTTAVAAATTPTATGFAHRIERRDAVGLCKEPKASCDGAGDGAVVHVDTGRFDLGRALVWTSILSRPLTARAPPCIGL